MDNAVLKFPCRIDVKVMGRAEAGFTELVVELVKRHAPDITHEAVSSRRSRQGNYIALTISVYAESREQMDALYRELTAHDKIAVAL